MMRIFERLRHPPDEALGFQEDRIDGAEERARRTARWRGRLGSPWRCPDPPLCWFDSDGNNCIEEDRKTGLRYDADEERVSINASQHFAPIL